MASFGFIDIFTPQILTGDIRKAFTSGNAMLTESVAKQICGNEDPIGKTFFYWNQPIIVAAICADFPDNCSFKNGVYFYQPETHRRNWNYTTYLKINPKDKDNLIKKLNEDKYLQRETNKDKDWKFELTALPDVHLHFPAMGDGSFTTIISLIAIGILLLIVSYINFLNFSIATASTRIKNFNIRKILGENSWSLKFSVISEIMFFSFVAFLLSILIVYFLNILVMRDFFSADISVSKNGTLLLLTGVFSLISGFSAGIYPAYYITSFKPATALNGSFALSSSNKLLKNILIVLQFVTAIFLIIVTLFVKIQHDFLRYKDWGLRTENILFFDTQRVRSNVENIVTELKKNPNIVDITIGSQFPGQKEMRRGGRIFEETSISVTMWYIKPNFFDFFGIKVIEGHQFDENDDKEKIIFNQSFLNKYNFSNITGKIMEDVDSDLEVVGIVQDFNFKSLQEDIKPMALLPITQKTIGYYNNWTFVKITGQNVSQTIDYIHDIWKKFSKEHIDVKFLDETIADLYKKENNLANLVSVCGIIAVIVTIMGLYGLILFHAKSKRKSIAIRKVHGASKSEIIYMLNKGLVVQVAIAYIISVPIAYLVVRKWLEGFAYKTPVYWWVFILGGIIILLISALTVSRESYKAANTNLITAIKTE